MTTDNINHAFENDFFLEETEGDSPIKVMSFLQNLTLSDPLENMRNLISELDTNEDNDRHRLIFLAAEQSIFSNKSFSFFIGKSDALAEIAQEDEGHLSEDMNKILDELFSYYIGDQSQKTYENKILLYRLLGFTYSYRMFGFFCNELNLSMSI